MKNRFDVKGEWVVVAGGSKGLGKELALQLVALGANVHILARSEQALNATCHELEASKKSPEQKTIFSSVDLTNPEDVTSFMNSLSEPPIALFCVTGGTSAEIGFFTDISPEHIRQCYERNYLSAAYITQALLKRWVVNPPATRKVRHIVFIASTAALVTIPGYDAYTPPKMALRGLADILRQEVLLYQNDQDIAIHCAFPGTIYTEEFAAEQKRKPALTKKLERTDVEGHGLGPDEVARRTLAGLRKGQYFICMDIETRMLLNNMRGSSPRDSIVFDRILGCFGSVFWPIYQKMWDRQTKDYGTKQLKKDL